MTVEKKLSAIIPSTSAPLEKPPNDMPAIPATVSPVATTVIDAVPADVAAIIAKFIEHGLVKQQDGKMVITETGRAVLDRYAAKSH